MAVVIHPSYPTQQDSDALATDDIMKGMGSGAGEIFGYLDRSTRVNYGSSESLPHHPSYFFPPRDPRIFERYARISLRDTFNDLERLKTWEAGWNSYDALKPQDAAIVNAWLWAIGLFQAVADLGWIKPNVTGGPDGGVVFEWWYGRRKLTVYIEEQDIEYVQVWGTDVDAEITSGDIGSMAEARELWMWLIGLK
jgi:hypothetical protein